MCKSIRAFDACVHEYSDEIESYGSWTEGFKYEFNGKISPYISDALI